MDQETKNKNEPPAGFLLGNRGPQPKLKKGNKKFFLLGALLFAALAAVLFWTNSSPKDFEDSQSIPGPVSDSNQPGQTTPAQNPSPIQGQTILPNDQLPEGITKDMILDDNAAVLNSYEYSDPATGNRQSTLRYKSILTITDLRERYLSFFTDDNGWVLSEGVVLFPDMFSIAGVKDGLNLNVSGNLNDKQESVVDLTLTP